MLEAAQKLKARRAKRKPEREQKLQEKKLAEQQLQKEVEAQDAARAACQHIAYVGPQRTAGVTLARNILPSNAAANNQTLHGSIHIEYNWANATAPNCIIASLRDPVERFLSEYSAFRDNPEDIFEH